MKALKLLKILKDDYIHGELDKDINEAIKELEALQSRSCEGCKYLEQKFHHISPRCVVHEYLLTNYSKKVFCCNRYEAKDTKCY